MKYLLLLIGFLSISISAQSQVDFDIDSTNFRFRRLSDSTVILRGGLSLFSGLDFSTKGSITVEKDSLSGRAVLRAADNPDIRLFDKDNNYNVRITSKINDSGGGILLSDMETGRENVIRLVTNFQNTGDARVFTDEIQINGGSDLAEMFDITDPENEIEPGLLVSLDPDQPGKLMITKERYDKKIAGIISGANGVKPGILMGQNESIAFGDDLITLSGRTYVMANTSNGAIEVGDLLTSSDTAGQAMRATKKKKSAGAVIGKAMTPLEKGKTGYILVLVNMQ